MFNTQRLHRHSCRLLLCHRLRAYLRISNLCSPTPKGMAPAPVDSSIPSIPSSPSPPNPDSMLAPGPGFELAPSGSLLESGSVSLTLDGDMKSTLFLGLVGAVLSLQ
ncbi:hypothetical protein F3Y22_tig00110607pilonHSYRG00008 [Hibiscus syriacus]|uniref:Uncharacterized protein n=1 Tax=Hibiscus syriacus TaxID=106335 RepID=A0A6A3A2M2_HIBSY|nr:classical arabinogalactan protein 26-like [Hibiscus syriacus]KAE8697897.1 hypothetical protein F3Y22_tig00110607pilonHSYRG00008 [Hibiscus syriacus]